eukprot:15442021-Alexandrium_andersonii.AAC.1
MGKGQFAGSVGGDVVQRRIEGKAKGVGCVVPIGRNPFRALIRAMHGTREGRVGPGEEHVISHSALIRAMQKGGME